jgi:hypothetical protein
VLEAHKEQPKIEKRFEQTKTVHEIAPVFLKNEDRVEAFFFLYFIALLVQALIERELRNAMAERGIEELPLYPEERKCRRPTTEQVFRLFSLKFYCIHSMPFAISLALPTPPFVLSEPRHVTVGRPSMIENTYSCPQGSFGRLPKNVSGSSVQDRSLGIISANLAG